MPEQIKFKYNKTTDSYDMLCNQYEHSSHDVLGFSQQRGVSQAVKARCVDAFTTFDARPKEMLKVLKREIPNKECLPSLDQLRNLKKNCIKTYQNSLELITKDDYIEFFKKHTVATKESYENLSEDDLIILDYLELPDLNGSAQFCYSYSSIGIYYLYIQNIIQLLHF